MKLREATYQALIRPTLEYASAVWDLYLARDIITAGCVSKMITEFSGSPLKKGQIHILTLLY